MGSNYDLVCIPDVLKADDPGHRPKNFPGNLLHFFSPFLRLPHSGDIEVFKGMPLNSLNLFACYQLTGVFGLGWGMVGGVKIGNRCCPKATP